MDKISINELYRMSCSDKTKQTQNNIRNISINEECVKVQNNTKRYLHLENIYIEKFGHDKNEKFRYFSAPGRCEITGNHTDHNGGKVIAASIDKDTIAVAVPNDDNVIRIFSEGHDYIEVDINSIVRAENKNKTAKADNCLAETSTNEKNNEKNNVQNNKLNNEQQSGQYIQNDVQVCDYEYIKQGGSSALVYGMAKYLIENGCNIGGFNAAISSEVLSGSGISSSASYEMLICAIFNALYNRGLLSIDICAKSGQYAENKFWNKASGLMDQIACAAGGMVLMDFSDMNNVHYESVDYEFDDTYEVIIVNTGGGHANLSDYYSSIPHDMYYVAGKLGVNRLCETDMKSLMTHISDIDNDRAILRAMHFYNENARVIDMENALRENNIKRILEIVKESGDSSYKLLQNCYYDSTGKEQKVALALAVSQQYIDQSDTDNTGCCRVHGGGFAGTIMALIRKDAVDDYCRYIGGYFGNDNVFRMNIRRYGAVEVDISQR